MSVAAAKPLIINPAFPDRRLWIIGGDIRTLQRRNQPPITQPLDVQQSFLADRPFWGSSDFRVG